MLLSELLAWGRQQLVARAAARAEAEILLAHVCGVGRGELMKRVLLCETAEAAAVRRYRELVRRCAGGYPLQYLTGRAGFWRHELAVGPGVLIPRPETETLVEQALPSVRRARVVWDLGTGSGCIALALAAAAPNTQFLAVDKSRAALHWARINTETVPNVTLLEADFTRPDQLPAREDALGQPEIIVSNPPYLDELSRRAVEHYEPQMALSHGDNSERLIARLAEVAADRLDRGGLLILEHAASQREKVAGFLLECGFERSESFADLNGMPRFTRAFR